MQTSCKMVFCKVIACLRSMLNWKFSQLFSQLINCCPSSPPLHYLSVLVRVFNSTSLSTYSWMDDQQYTAFIYDALFGVILQLIHVHRIHVAALGNVRRQGMQNNQSGASAARRMQGVSPSCVVIGPASYFLSLLAKSSWQSQFAHWVDVCPLHMAYWPALSWRQLGSLFTKSFGLVNSFPLRCSIYLFRLESSLLDDGIPNQELMWTCLILPAPFVTSTVVVSGMAYHPDLEDRESQVYIKVTEAFEEKVSDIAISGLLVMYCKLHLAFHKYPHIKIN